MKRLEFEITDAMIEEVDEDIERAARATLAELERERQRAVTGNYGRWFSHNPETDWAALKEEVQNFDDVIFKINSPILQKSHDRKTK